MTAPSKPVGEPLSPAAVATAAGTIMSLAQENTGLSLLELAIVFKAAALICDECGMAYERAQMQQKMRNWRPGGH